MTLLQRILAIRQRLWDFFLKPTTKILPLGASRVDADGDYESFRFYLWKKHRENRNKIKFIGTETDTKNYGRIGRFFTRQHFGFGAISIKNLRTKLLNSINNFEAPDIVLFSSPGGNDFANGVAYNKVINEINNIIDILQDRNPDVTIIIEKMARPAPSLVDANYLQLEPIFFQDLDIIATNKTTATSDVLTINMQAGFNNETMLFDNVHYNKKGAKFIANKYFNLLKNIL